MNRFSNHWFSVGMILLWFITWFIGLNHNLTSTFSTKGIASLNQEYYRFGTSLLLHSNFLHMLSNALALYFVGRYLEMQIRPWNLLIFSIAVGVMTNMIFACIYKTSSSVGGSPIIFGLIGLIIALQITNSAECSFQPGTWYGNWITAYTILANVPFFSSSFISTLLIHGMALLAGVLLGCIGIFTRIFNFT